MTWGEQRCHEFCSNGLSSTEAKSWTLSFENIALVTEPTLTSEQSSDYIYLIRYHQVLGSHRLIKMILSLPCCQIDLNHNCRLLGLATASRTSLRTRCSTPETSTRRTRRATKRSRLLRGDPETEGKTVRRWDLDFSFVMATSELNWIRPFKARRNMI